jgi:uncharacterized membrane protein
MVGAATLWGLARRDSWRFVLLLAAAVALTMLTPIVRMAGWLAPLPDPIEWYLRPYPGRTTFTLFPWAGFLFAGAALGVSLNRAGTPETQRRLIVMLAVLGPVIAIAGYAASFLPPIYEQSNFWTSSPTFFFLRVGVLIAIVPAAYVISQSLRAVSQPLEYFGRASLFVYWIHVEMVYGVASAAIHKRLTFEQALLAFSVFSAFLFVVAKLKDLLVARWQGAPTSLVSSP